MVEVVARIGHARSVAHNLLMRSQTTLSMLFEVTTMHAVRMTLSKRPETSLVTRDHATHAVRSTPLGLRCGTTLFH